MNTFLASATALMLVAPATAGHGPIRDAQWHLTYLHVAEAHQYSRGDGVTVALIDTGVDIRHPDLAPAKTLSGADFTYQGPGNGLVDTDGHGTSEAGLIFGNGEVLGIAPNANLQSVRASPSSIGIGAATATAIDWAVGHGAKVLCIASGGSSYGALSQAVERAVAADVVVVVAAGNRPGTTVDYPAAYPGVVAVAATDRNGNHAAISVTGTKVIIAAPGENIMTTDNLDAGTGGYAARTGTSASTAIIAGAAALIRSKYPNLSATEVIHRLTATADDKGPPGQDPEYGYGIVNLVKALTADVAPLTTPTTTTTGPTTSAQGATPAPGTGPGATLWLLAGVLLALLLAGAAMVVTRRR